MFRRFIESVAEFLKKIHKWTNSHKTIFALIITLLFVLAQVPILLNHESWSDEAVSWGFSKQLTFSNVYEINSAEPHPFLWQFVLAPFSKLGMPFDMISCISLAIVAIAVFLFFRFAPMNILVKSLFIISSGFFFFNSIIARNYALIPLAICLICMTYEKRHEKPLLYGLSIAFLAQTHFLMYGFVGALALGFVIEETFEKNGLKKMLKNILVFAAPVLLSIGLALPMIISSLQNQPMIAGKYSFMNPEDRFGNFFGSVVGFYVGIYTDAIAIVLMVLFGLFLLVLLADNIKLFLYIISGIAVWAFMILTKYYMYHIFEQKLSMIPLMILAIIWMSYLESDKKRTNIFKKLFSHAELIKFFLNRLKAPAIVFGMLIVSLTIPRVINQSTYDYKFPFTNSKRVAEYIKDTFEDGALIIEADTHGSATIGYDVLARLEGKNYTFYNALMRDIIDDYAAKMKYDVNYYEKEANFIALSDDELKDLLEKYKKEFSHIYLLIGIPTCDNALPFNHKVLGEYEEISIISDGGVNPIARPPVRVYKIK